jgi:hypothetical protein
MSSTADFHVFQFGSFSSKVLTFDIKLGMKVLSIKLLAGDVGIVDIVLKLTALVRTEDVLATLARAEFGARRETPKLWTASRAGRPSRVDVAYR